MDEKQAQLEWEARAGRLAGFAAWFAAALIVAGFVYQGAALPKSTNTAREFLPVLKAHENAFLLWRVLSGVAMLAFIPPLLYLYRVTRFRRPALPSVARILLIAGPVLFAVCAVWVNFRHVHAADQFLAGSVKTNKHAEDLVRNATTVVAGLSLAASIATGLGTVLVSLNAMRAGLLSRFMGFMGLLLGGLFVLPLIASPIIQLFWLIALGVLFVNIWPGGRGPAWETGEEVPWPSAQDRVAPPDGEEDVPERELEPEPVGDGARQPNPRASRKRKKRR